MSAHVGIDYGMGTTNIDTTTGIRYGVISQNSINPECTNDFELDYGKPHCPKCGNPVSLGTTGEEEYVCEQCQKLWGDSDVYSEEAQGFTYEADGYQLTNCLDNDIFVLASPYYTFAQFCSPCVPGAGNLDNPTPDGVKTYCLDHDWFDGNKAPYPVYKVADDTEEKPQ